MREAHEHDCAIHTSPICDCGVLLRASRRGDCQGIDEHRAALKKLRNLLEAENTLKYPRYDT